MNIRKLMQRLSTRSYLALGLSSLTVTLLLGAGLLGLVPDRDRLLREQRLALAETIALTTSGLLDEEEPGPLARTLAYVRARHAELRSIGVRRADGTLLVDVDGHAGRWTHQGAASTADALVVPVALGGTPWGALELQFEPLQPPGWRGWLHGTELQLALFMFVAGLLAYGLYLKRMLKHLDPSRAIPGRVRSALDTLTEGLLVLDAEGRIVLANQSLADVLGVEPDSLIGREAGSIAWARRDGTPVERGALPWDRTLLDGTLQRHAILYVTGVSGRPSTFRTNASPVPGADGRAQGVLVSLQDVTELEEKELALQLAKDEADQANAAKSTFLANMSHEIRTPMNAILGFTEVLRRGGLRSGDDARRQLDIIHRSGRHLLNLINDILDL